MASIMALMVKKCLGAKLQGTASYFEYFKLILYRLRTNQNLATELDLAIVAKRSFKIVYISYIYIIIKRLIEKLQVND